MSRARKRKTLRNALFNKNPHCYFCGIPVVMREIKPHAQIPPDTAVVHNLFKKFEKIPGNRNTKVLSCNKCSFDIGNNKVKLLDIHVRRAWARHFHTGFNNKIRHIGYKILKFLFPS